MHFKRGDVVTCVDANEVWATTPPLTFGRQYVVSDCIAGLTPLVQIDGIALSHGYQPWFAASRFIRTPGVQSFED